MKHKLIILLTLIAVLAMVIPASAKMIDTNDALVAASPDKVASNGNYIVLMSDAPVIDYTGGVVGFRATATNGAKINPTNPDVVKYANYLKGKHDVALKTIGVEGKFYDYVYTLNGFAAKLTPAQAAQLMQVTGVVSVTADELRYADTITTPTFLGLAGAGGLWQTLGGTNIAGRNIIVGVIDSGIWPENPSFAWNNNLGIRPMARWNGICQDGEDWTADLCNGKLLGARYFNGSWGGDDGINAQRPWEFNSPRDYNGHGSHTSSTAAGNNGVDVVIQGTNLGKASGMAPNARVAMYKALWSTQDAATASGYTADLVAAIDQAVADGVDVINYSISGSTTSITGLDEQAFMRAARAGVFVATSAGNSGPTASTVAHNSPWVTTVAAGTHDRVFQATVTLGNAAVYTGVSIGAGTPVLPVVLSTAVGLPGANTDAVRYCYSAVYWGTAVLDPTKVAGKIVVCDRGISARVDKSLAVFNAGGLGMILANVSPSTLNADTHSVPTVHVDEVAGAAIKAYVSADPASATAQLSPFFTGTTVAPDIASFSSRGPARAVSGNILKPDIMAPGVDVLAAVSPVSAGGQNFASYQGTSMASPHIAGIAALFKQAHPDWSPMMIKSALMTTASQTRNNGTPIAGGVFAYGAGEVTPKSAYDPGLVYDTGIRDWVGYLCGLNLLVDPRCPILAIDVNNLNTPSVAISALAGAKTVTRTVTSVGKGVETYTPSVVGLAGINVVTDPASFTIKPGKTQTFKVTFTRVDAALNTYAQGFLVWTGNLGHVVQIPVAIRPVALAAPAEVSGTGADITYPIQFGYDGSFTATPRGLIPAVTFDGSVATNESVSFDVVVLAGTTFARFALFNAYTTAPDLDLRVYRGSTLVGSSGGSTSDEVVSLLNPTAATYKVYVDGYGTGGVSAPFTLFTWVLGTADAGNMVITAPSTAVIGASGTITLSFTGLTPAKWLGSVVYGGASGMPNPTIVSVDTNLSLLSPGGTGIAPSALPLWWIYLPSVTR